MHNLFGERFYGNRTPAWHSLGKVSQVDNTASEALGTLTPYWIEKRPVTVFINNANVETGDFALVRSAVPDDQEERLFGYVTKHYQILQPIEICETFDNFVRQPVETLGMLGKGEKLFLTWKLPKILVKSDEIQNYGFVAVGYDGKFGASLYKTSVRVVCQNTWVKAISKAENTEGGKVWTGKHTSSNMLRDLGIWMEHIQNKVMADVAKSEEELNRMASYNVTDEFLKTVLGKVYATSVMPEDYPDKLRQQKEESIDKDNKTAENDKNLVMQLFGGLGTEIDTTAYGLFNAITEYENYGRMTKKPAFSSIVIGNRANTMTHAYNTIMAEISR